MKHIGLIDFRFDPAPLLGELADHPEAWNTITHRISHPQSPHRKVSDIWVRYNALDNFKGDMQVFNGPHESVWYPVAEQLPTVKVLSSDLMVSVGGESLGGILITRIPSHAQVYPHVDQGWHAGHYQKYGLQLKGNERQAFCFNDGELSALPGEAYFFDNHIPHWVRNDSDEERITLIVTLRREPCH